MLSITSRATPVQTASSSMADRSPGKALIWLKFWPTALGNDGNDLRWEMILDGKPVCVCKSFVFACKHKKIWNISAANALLKLRHSEPRLTCALCISAAFLDST
jgi:hypothetical protein